MAYNDTPSSNMTTISATATSLTTGFEYGLWGENNTTQLTRDMTKKMLVHPLSMTTQTGMLALAVFIGLLTFVSNSLYIVIFRKKGGKLTNSLLLSLCWADLIRAVPIAINRLSIFISNPSASGILRVSLRTVVSFSGIVVQYHQTFIAVDRLLIVSFPIWYQTHMKPKHAKRVVAAIWGITALYFFPIVIYYYVSADLSTVPSIGLPSQIMPKKLSFALLYGQRFSLAACCLLLYCCIFYKILKLKNKPMPAGNAAANQQMRHRIRRLSLVGALITITYLIPWFSSSVLQMVIPFEWFFKFPYMTIIGLTIEQLTYIPAWLNPIIIVSCSPQHRATFIKALRKATSNNAVHPDGVAT